MVDQAFYNDYKLAIEHSEYLNSLDGHIRGTLGIADIKNKTTIQMMPVMEAYTVNKQPPSDNKGRRVINNRFSEIRKYKEIESRGKYTVDRSKSGIRFAGWEYNLEKYPNIELVTYREYLGRLLDIKRKNNAKKSSLEPEPEFDEEGNRLPRRYDCWWAELGYKKCCHPFLIQSVESDAVKGYYCTSSSVIFEGRSPIRTTAGVMGVHNASPVLRTISKSMLQEY